MAIKHTVISVGEVPTCSVCGLSGNELKELPSCDSLTKTNKEWIDNASYEDMLRRNRFSKSGDSIFMGEMGIYFLFHMNRKRLDVGQDKAAEISKKIGWGQ